MWLWLTLGALVLFGRRRALGMPVEGQPVRVTPRGQYGANRQGPPAHAHQGVDVAASPGTPVLAVGDGVIVAARPGVGRIVRKLRLDQPSMWAWSGRRVVAVVYADLGPTFVEPGDRVRRGDAIARIGDAGFFHFAVKTEVDGREQFIDPSEAGFPPPSGREVTA
jgi:murein DD-endopeptidase MepM/ murein hydrolase activator NlpD